MADWGRDALRAFYLFLPLLVAAALSGLVLRNDALRSTAIPIDLGATLGGVRVLGDGKTWRGVLTAVVGCVLGVWLQKYTLHPIAASIEVVRYGSIHAFVFGATMGASAMAGELPNSFVKRRLGIARGEAPKGAAGIVFYVWDQVDVLTVAWPALSPWVRPDARLVAASFVVALVVHPLVALVGYLVGARTSPR